MFSHKSKKAKYATRTRTKRTTRLPTKYDGFFVPANDKLFRPPKEIQTKVISRNANSDSKPLRTYNDSRDSVEWENKLKDGYTSNLVVPLMNTKDTEVPIETESVGIDDSEDFCWVLPDFYDYMIEDFAKDSSNFPQFELISSIAEEWNQWNDDPNETLWVDALEDTVDLDLSHNDLSSVVESEVPDDEWIAFIGLIVESPSLLGNLLGDQLVPCLTSLKDSVALYQQKIVGNLLEPLQENTSFNQSNNVEAIEFSPPPIPDQADSKKSSKDSTSLLAEQLEPCVASLKESVALNQQKIVGNLLEPLQENTSFNQSNNVEDSTIYSPDSKMDITECFLIPKIVKIEGNYSNPVDMSDDQECIEIQLVKPPVVDLTEDIVVELIDLTEDAVMQVIDLKTDQEWQTVDLTVDDDDEEVHLN